MLQSSILLRIAVFLCITAPLTAIGQNSSGTSIGGIPFTYSLSTNAKTSAGVFKPDSTLIRTLWSGEQRNAGANTASWDGKDDNGNTVADGNYQIRVLSNNITYTWEGVLGNSSKYSSGSTVHHPSAEGFWDMRIVGKKAVHVVEYNEGYAAEFTFNTDSPQVRLPLWNNPMWQMGKTGLVSSHVCTDGTNFYFGGILAEGGSTFTNPRSFVYAKKVTDYTNVIFANGVQTQPLNGPTEFVAYPSTIDNFQPPSGNNYYRIDGIAVQKTSNYLFVTRRYLNSLHVLNKTTGALVQSLTYTSPTQLETDNQNNLWMLTGNSCKKYTVNNDGTLSAATLTLSGLVAPIAMQVTPDGTKLYVIDGGNSQQIKIYNNSTGVLVSTFGQAGGYATSPDVADNKFMFQSTKSFYGLNQYPYNLPDGNGSSFICFDAADDSYWFWDCGNQRVMHFSNSNVLKESISCIGYNYSCSVDYNNPTRVFSNYLEFEVDYSKPLAPNNSSWKLKRNWAYNASFANDDQFYRLQGIASLSNGKTYATHKTSTGNTIVELAATGLRFTGIALNNSTVMNQDGSLTIYSQGAGTSGNPTTWNRRVLSGFDSNNNPTWDTPTPIASNTNGSIDPANEGTSLKHQQVTSSGILAYFDEEKSGGYHLGGIKLGDNKWLWRASRSTHSQYRGEFPTDGTFEIGNSINYAGGSMQAIEKSIFYSYKGENWKGTETNKYNQYYDNGLFVGQFGITGVEAYELYGNEAPPMMAGNTTTMPIVKVGNDYYLYQNDESFHGGVHRWKISGLNTIDVQSVSIVKSGTPPSPVYDYVDLMAGLPFNDTLTNNTAGWTRFSPESGSFSVTTNYGTYKKSDRDLRIVSIGQNIDCWVKRDLGTNTGLANWKIIGEMAYPEAGENQDNFVEVRDANDKIIVRISRPETYPNLEIKANRSRIAYGSDVYATVGRLLPLSVVASGGNITVNFGNYAPVTVTPFDSTANIGNPKILQLYTVSNPSGHQIDVALLKFYKTITPVVIVRHFRSKNSGLWKNVSTWESSIDSTTWADATTVPDSTAGAVTIRSGHTVAITDSANADQLTIQSSGALNIAPNASFVINDGPGNDVTVSTSGKLTIQSDSTGSGRIGKSSGTVTGYVTVERYITASNNKAYRLLAPSLTTIGGPKPFIRDNWQEGQNNANILSNSDAYAGHGIHITGSINGSNGFDATITGVASMYYYNQAATVQAWQPIANTNATNFETGKGYMVYIRGDRSTDLQMNTSTSNTTLRTTGSIATGTQTFSGMESNGRNSLVTNPYPSPIDWNVLYNDATTSNATNFENFYTYLDPNIGLSGGYVTVAANGTKSAGTNATTEIQTGQAFFIKAKPGITSPSFVIKESHKSPTNNLNVFRNGGREQFMSSLYFTDANGNKILADAVNNVFDNAFSTDVDRNDAEELANWDENVAILRSGKMLSIEGRPLIDVTDTVQLNVQRLRMINYEWQFKPMAFTHPTLKAYLEDKYTNTRTQIDLGGSTIVVSFSVTADMASSAADRFRIVFAPNSSLPVTLYSVKAYQKGPAIQIDWMVSQETNIDHYEVENSVDGRQFIKIGSVLAQNGNNLSNTYNWLDQYPKEGNNFYRIKTVDKSGTISYSSIVNVKIGGKKESLEVYPNPVIGSNITIQLNNVARGTYTISVLNVMGQKIISKMINHPGGSASQSIILNNGLPVGSYNIQVSGNGINFNQKIVKQ